jgi:hypothetical protein
MVPYYNQIVTQYRVLIYSGDVDSCVPYIGTQIAAQVRDETSYSNFSQKIQASGQKSGWSAWMLNNQVAGYKLGLGDNLTFITIKEAGHMVSVEPLMNSIVLYNSSYKSGLTK